MPTAKAGLYAADGKLKPAVKQLLEGGATVIGVDLIYQGEFLPAGTRSDWKKLAASTTRKTPAMPPVSPMVIIHPSLRSACKMCFRRSARLGIFARRTAVVTRVGRPIDLVGLDGGAAWVAAAKAQAGKAVDRVAIDTAGFRFAKAKSIDDPDFWPGAVKYGDLPAVLALDAEGELWLVRRRAGIARGRIADGLREPPVKPCHVFSGPRRSARFGCRRMAADA